MGGDVLSERAAVMSESLLKSQSITDSVVSVLGSFDHRLSALETAMRPTQAEAKILKGPHDDLESYLEAIQQLRSNILFFNNNKRFKSSDGVVNHSNNLLAKAISKLEEEFKQLLSSYSKPVEPERLFECLPSSLRPSSESSGNQGDSTGRNPSSNSHSEHHHNNNLANADFTPPTLIPLRILPLLHNLAQQMVQAGHQQQLLKIYRQGFHSYLLWDTRSSVLEESLRKLGVEKLSKDDVQKMQWEVLEVKIGNWIHFMRISVKLLFAGEWKVCNQMFEGIDSLRDVCFAEVTASSVSVLLSFGDAIAKSKRSPEKLFVLFDMYEIMQELHSEIETLFKGKACNEIRESAFGLTKWLAQTAQETFGDFEEAVEKDATKTAVLDGTVHPLTSYVINYVKFLFDYQSTLKQLFQEFENGEETNSQLASVTMRIMQALQTNLDGKSKQYKDIALTHLFLMNNIHYMVRSVRRSEAKDLLGDDWVQRHRRIVQQHANQYKRIAWAKDLSAEINIILVLISALLFWSADLSCRNLAKWWRISLRTANRRFFLGSLSETRPDLVGNSPRSRRKRAPNSQSPTGAMTILQCLSVQGLTSSGGGSAVGVDGGNSSGVSRAVVKDKLKTFNMQFEELHQRQSQWTVPDSELRESLRLAVAEVLLPAYRSFIKRFGPLVESGKNPMKYISDTARRILTECLVNFLKGKP
ncbi:exocyst subunit exo70 family protein A1 [Actinidia rufa]|uniref:Exocyst subunit Exo70 family protein n=1 Tax=Actinidia rufa TaxID=165716 RepID=A0A7J0DZQ3_9ERIC|nr:exocyst subunit exo70 family protein A1 [Actinidia rufa]